MTVVQVMYEHLQLNLKIIWIIANTKKYLLSHWLRGVQYWPYLYSVFNISTLLLNKKNHNAISVAEK